MVSGDPIGPPDEKGEVLDEFLGHARARGWHVAVLGASDRVLQAYRDRGLHPIYHGDEAIIDIASFSLDGRPMRATRQAVHRLERRGYQAEAMRAGTVPPSLRAELAAMEKAWLHGDVRKGFTMELDSLFRLGGADAVFVIGRDADGRLAGCLHMAVCASSRSLSLSSMPRTPGTPNGFSAWLIVNAVAWARRNGFEHLSLNFAPFAELLSADAPSSAQRLKRTALLKLKHALALQLDNLVRFDRQFSPRWQSRYVVVEHRTDLPRVALAAMTAEGYLPHADLVRGANWMPGGSEPAAEAPATAEQPVAGSAARVPAQRRPAEAGQEQSQPADGGWPQRIRQTRQAMMLAAGLLLALLSTAALSGGFYLQHAASQGLPELTVRHPLASLLALFTNLRWVTGFVTGLAGWALYIVALDLAPLSLVQAVSAGGMGLLAVLVRIGGVRLSARERVAVAASVGGLLLIGLSLPAHSSRSNGWLGFPADLGSGVATASGCGHVSRQNFATTRGGTSYCVGLALRRG